MAGVVVDSTVLIDVLRSNAEAAAWLRSQSDVPACSEVTRVEIIRGLRSIERTRAETLFGAFDWIPVTESVSRLAGEFGRQHRHSHQGIALADLVIAATAQLLHSTVATQNLKHFPMFPALVAPY